jgi:DNA-binding transcriptional ArsR family regulator
LSEERGNVKTLEDIDNELKKVRSDTHNINRILTLTNKELIIKELQQAVGRSEVRAAILILTKENISAGELSRQLGISADNLAMYMKPLLNRGYVTFQKKGTQRFFVRSELVELIRFESIPEFAKLLASWEQNMKRGTIETAPTQVEASGVEGQ